VVQKLFSMFPTGAPGIALLMLRCALSVLLYHSLTVGVPAIRIALGIFLCLGLATPLAAPIAGLLALLDAFSARSMNLALFLLLAVNAAALAMLGPGAYSVDARLFGRRLLVWPRDSDSSR